MKIAIESTTKVVEVNGVPRRIWEGHTESGIALHCFITGLAVENALDLSEFERELEEQSPPSIEVDRVYGMRMTPSTEPWISKPASR